MKSAVNDQSEQKQKRKSPTAPHAQSIKEINNEKLKKLGKCYHIVDSPQIVFDLCDKAYTKGRSAHDSNFIKDKVEFTKNTLEYKRRILQRKGFVNNRTPTPTEDNAFTRQTKYVQNQFSNGNLTDKLSYLDDRQFYKNIRDRLKTLIQKVQNQAQIMISQVMVLKQDILSSFFAQIIEKSKRECKQKGDLIHYIWNSMFSILQVALSQMVKEKNHNQKVFLTQNLDNHKKYQDMLEHYNQKIISLKEQLEKAEVFNNTLVFNLRCKRRELRKSYIKLKICINKLNQYKQNYLDLQRQHIDLIMETRDISKQMAEFLFNRRQEILQDKKKNFKLKFSKKNNFANTRKQIETEPTKNLELINEQLKTAFNKKYEKELALSQDKKLKKITNFLFEDATDEFAFYENTDCIDDDLMASKVQITFVDAQTDMIGFSIDVKDKECQIDYLQKIVYGLVKNNSTAQTIAVEQKQKKLFADTSAQVNCASLDQLNCQIQNRVYDMSFVFEGKRPGTKKLTLNKLVNKKSISPSKKNRPSHSNHESQNSLEISNQPSQQNGQRISRKISQISELSKFKYNEQNDSRDQDSVKKSKVETSNHSDNEFQNTDDEKCNFVDAISKFTLRKALAKNTRNGISLGFQRSQRYSMAKKSDLPEEGFVKTIKASRFSSVQTSPQKSNKISLFHSPKKAVKQQKKNLKRQPITRRENEVMSVQSNIQTNQKKIPSNSNIMKLLTKSVSQQVLSLHPNNFLAKLKVKNPSFVIDQQIQDFIKEKEDEQKQLFFKNFSQSIAPLMIDLDKNVESNKKYHKNILPARNKNLCKIISSVYMQAYQLLDKKEKLYSLINPLFKYFKMGYGMLKKSDLYTRMINFLSHVCIHKEESYVLYSFYFFTGIDKENPLSGRVTSQDFELYLKLLKHLSFNFNVNGLNVQNLYTQNLLLEKSTKEVLVEEKISEVIIEKVISKVQQKLEKLTGVDLRSSQLQSDSMNKFLGGTLTSFPRVLQQSRSQTSWNSQRQQSAKQEQQIKLDVFKCCQLIIEEIILMRKGMEQSYLPLIIYAYKQENVQNMKIDQELIQFIIRCQFKQQTHQIKSYQLLKNIFKINNLYKQYKTILNSGRSILKQEASINTHKTIRTLKSIKAIQIQSQDQINQINEKQTLSLSQMCTFFLKANIFDLNKTYYNALNIFKLKEQAALNMCIKRLPDMRKFFQKQNLKIQLILLQKIIEEGQINQLNLLNSYEPISSNLFKTLNRPSRYESSHSRYDSMMSPQKDTTNGLTLKLIQNKKIIILCFLRFLESQVNETVEKMFSAELNFLHTFIPISNIKL